MKLDNTLFFIYGICEDNLISNDVFDVTIQDAELLRVENKIVSAINIVSDNENDISIDGYFKYLFIIPVKEGSSQPFYANSAIAFQHNGFNGFNEFIDITNPFFEKARDYINIHKEFYADGVIEYVVTTDIERYTGVTGVGYSVEEALASFSDALLALLEHRNNQRGD